MTRAAKSTSRPQRRTARPAPPARRSWAVPIVTAGAVAVAVLVIVVAMAQQSAGSGPGDPRLPSSSDTAIVTPSTAVRDSLGDGPTLGRSGAAVTLEIWSDYQCPYCGELARSYLPRLVGDFVTPGTVRILAQDIAFLDRGTSTESTDAAAAAACAGDQGFFWAFHDLLMWNQAGENAGAFADTRLEAMAARAHLDLATWNACRAAPATARNVTSRTARASALGIVSTPTLIINGQALVGLPKTYDILASAIRDAVPGGASGAPSAAPLRSAAP